ncbi:MAG: hypothetical protein C0623_11665 [Desulfuromonas sp.]|nr:MAG: hypothetical protein C0623_11665 [Desulfuromonas sp.]
MLKQFHNGSTLKEDNKLFDFIIGDTGSDSLSKAFGLTFKDGKLFIVDSGKASPSYLIVDFDLSTMERHAGQLIKPIHISIDAEGNRYISDTVNRAVIVFNQNDKYLRKIKLDEKNFWPTGLQIIDDRLYVSDLKANLIRVFDKDTGKLLNTFGQNDRLGWPTSISLMPNGNLLVTETLAAALRLYTKDGTSIKQIGSPGDRAGNFARPKGTAVDKNGNIYAVDVAFQNVQILNTDGDPLMYFGSTGDNNSLWMPAGIAISYDVPEALKKLAKPGFNIEYIIAVSSQGGPHMLSKISVYGFGKQEGIDYSKDGD